MGQNVGGESSLRSAGMSFPSMDDNRYHFNYNPVTVSKKLISQCNLFFIYFLIL